MSLNDTGYQSQGPNALHLDSETTELSYSLLASLPPVTHPFDNKDMHSMLSHGYSGLPLGPPFSQKGGLCCRDKKQESCQFQLGGIGAYTHIKRNDRL